MSFIKNYWFGTLTAILVTVFVVMLFLILLAPKQDAKERGFIPCTQNMVDDLISCERGIICSGKAILNNTWCDLKVIGKGINLWVKGEQQRPWSNYIFEADIPNPSFVDEEARQQYLKEHPDVFEEMKRLHKLRKELENEQNRQTGQQDLWQQQE